MQIGERIKYLRETKGFTQVELAKRIGIHSVSLSRYERGEEIPNDAMIEKIAAALEVSTAKVKNKLPRERRTAKVLTISELVLSYNERRPIIIEILQGQENECGQLYPGIMALKELTANGNTEFVGIYKYDSDHALAMSDYEVTWVAYKYDEALINEKYTL